jgi:pilus assembly protein CpaE
VELLLACALAKQENQMPDINNILVFSTEPSVADQLARSIGPHAGQVQQATSVDKALATVDETAPEAFVVHLERNRQDGLSLVNKLRFSHPKEIILAVSRHKDPDLILAGLRAGISDYLIMEGNAKPLSTALTDALHSGAGRSRTGELIAVYSIKGGQGVTTVAVNLADHIQALAGGKVLLADLHLYRGDVADFLNRTCTYTLFHLAGDLQRMDSHLLFSSLNRHKNRFYLVGTSGDISDAEKINTENLSRMVELFKHHFDTIVVDLPSDCSEKSLTVLAAADRIVLVVQQTIPEIRSLQSTIDFFREIHPDDQRLEIVINRFSKASDLGIAELETLVDCPVSGTIASDYKAVAHAIDHGKTLSTACPAKRINRDFNRLAARLTGLASTARQPSPIRALTAWLKQ